ncbi:hypothetical protein PUN28_005284 [Cardiocondyla obscurior]|uniref:Uncharacterized protein n=1 Tax=Cardiocondyla obscurior TaxID=286306 RepID=A0AAW2GF33_9HYME
MHVCTRGVSAARPLLPQENARSEQEARTRINETLRSRACIPSETVARERLGVQNYEGLRESKKRGIVISRGQKITSASKSGRAGIARERNEREQGSAKGRAARKKARGKKNKRREKKKYKGHVTVNGRVANARTGRREKDGERQRGRERERETAGREFIEQRHVYAR